MIDENKNRKAYWEINGFLHCPIVGTCLSLTEQKKLLKKSGYSIDGCSDHQIHHMLVQSGEKESPLSRRIQRILENKYKQEVAELGTCSEEIFMALWRKGLQRGEIDALLWIGATNPNLSPATTSRIFSDYHMHTHGQGMIIRRQLQQMDKWQKKNQRLSNSLKQVRIQKQQTVQSLHAAERECAALQQQVQGLQTRVEALQNRPEYQKLQKSNDSMEDKIQLLENKLQAQSELLAELKEENDQLTAANAELDRINQILRTEIDWLAQQAEGQSACANCPQQDICPCRVLIVGGLNNLRPHYQNLIENGGGEFKHVDGRNGTSERIMRPMIGWADVILCPVDFNSHRACLNVKKLCKKMQKPYHMLPNSSVSNVSRVLAEFPAHSFETAIEDSC